MKKYGIIGIVFVGVAVICAFTFRGHKEADYLLTDFPAEADPVSYTHLTLPTTPYV